MLVSGCKNPFAPVLDTSEGGNEAMISDLSNVDGVFKNIQYAYTFKDTTIYGGVIGNDFNFSYRDYSLGFDISWGRDEEMKATYGLFQNAQRLDLIWNNIVLISNDSTNIVRSFNLTITFNPTDIERVDGKVNLQLTRNSNKWQIVRWTDESNY